MEIIQVETVDAISFITLNRQPANALSQDLLKDLSSVLKHLEDSKETRVIVIKGEGKFFVLELI